MNCSKRRLLAAGTGLATAALAGCFEWFGDGTLSLSDSLETQAAADDWPLVHHDTRHTNANEAAKIARSEPEIDWRRSLSEERYTTNPIVVEGALYVGGDELRRLDPETGETLASSAEASRYYGVGYADETLYVGLETADGPALAAYEPTTLDRRWETAVPSDPDRSNQVLPPVATSQVSYGATTSGYFAVTADGELGWESDGVTNREGRLPAMAADTLVWQADTDVRIGPASAPADPDHAARLEHHMWSSPTIADDFVLVGEAVPGGPRIGPSTSSLYALTHEGDVEWELDVGTMARTPAVADGTAFIVSGRYAGEASGRCFGGNNSRFDVEIAAIDLETGDRRWSRTYDEYGTGLSPAPVRTAETVVSGTTACDGDHLLRAHDAEDGEQIWTLPVDGPLYGMAAVGDTVYASGGGTLSAIR